MNYVVDETQFEGLKFPSDMERQQFQTKYEDLTDEIGHVLDKNSTDFLFTSYIFLLEALSNGDNRIASKAEFEEIQRFCVNYRKTHDIKDNMLYEMAFGANIAHKERWDGYLSDGRMKHKVKSEQSLKPRIVSSIDYNDLLNSEPVKFAYDMANDQSQTYWVRLQAKQFIEDFTVNQFKDDFPYYFNAEVLRVVEVFLRQVNLATAKDVNIIGDSIVNHIMPFQYFMLINVWAWRKKDNFSENRFRKFVLFLPRKNGKSWLVSAVKMLGLILLPNNSELYSASNSFRESQEIRKELENITDASPSIKRYFKINRDRILALHSKSKFETLSGKPKDGSLPSIAAIDENGKSEPNNPVASSLVRGLAGSFQLAFYVSTAYDKYPSGMSIEVEIAKNSLDPHSEYYEERTFSMLYTAQNPDLEWTTAEALKATNPLMWEINQEVLITEQREAMENDTKENDFKTRRANIFLATNVGNSIAPIDNLTACYERKSDFDWNGKKAILGIDLSIGDDNSALSLTTFHEGKYYLKQWVFIPKGRVIKKENLEKVNYRHYEKDQQVIFTEDEGSNDNIINYKTIEEFIINLPKTLGVEITHMAYDVYGATHLIQNLQNKEQFYNTDFRLIQQNKTGRHFGIQLLRVIVMQRRLSFDHKMMINEWGAVQIKQTDNLYYPEKVKGAVNKTDMIYSFINALVVCSELYEVNETVYEEELIFSI